MDIRYILVIVDIIETVETRSDLGIIELKILKS